MRPWVLIGDAYHWQTGDAWDLCACGAHPEHEADRRSQPPVRLRCVPCQRAWKRRNGRKAIRRRNPERREKLFARNFGEHADYVRSLGCQVGGLGTTHAGRIHAHHVLHRGGRGDKRALIGVCAVHHEELHRVGRETFQRRYGCDLLAIAADNWAESPHYDAAA